MDKITELQSLLMDVQAHLVNLGFWDEEPPSEEAFASTAPFAVDTMEFYQWMQWIFLPRMTQLLEREAALPAQCGIAPMAEQWAAMRSLQATMLIDALQAIDEVLNR